MGIYAVTGGSNGIGAKTISILKQQGHTTINIDWKRGDIEADLSLPEGRQKAIDELRALCPDGLDGMILCAGIPGSRKDLRLILSVNYFGTIAMIKGTYALLKQRKGAFVVLASSAISREDMKIYLVDLLNNNTDDEYRILEVIGQMDKTDLSTGDLIYAVSKYALCRWMRRHSASYAANGVRINAVAPGNINAPMTATGSRNAADTLNALPIPTKYGTQKQMDAEEIASVITFLISDKACGVNGIIMFVDGGTDALLNTEKVY